MSRKSFLETFRQANSSEGLAESPDPRVLARVLRFIPKELSLRYEVSSPVYRDDDSQMLYDRWTYEEFWAYTPGTSSYYSAARRDLRIPVRDVSELRLQYAFARVVPAVTDNAQLASLVLAKNIVASSLREGIRASDKIIDRLIESEIAGTDVAATEDAVHQVPLSSGYALMFNPQSFCDGAVTVRKRDDRWQVGIVKEMASALLPDRGRYGPLISAELMDETATASKLALQLNADRIGRDTVLGIKQWVEDRQPPSEKEGYSVALSFAGEDRAIAEEVATCLVLNGFKVFYDEFETAEMWGGSLSEHLASVYRDRASYCVVFVSEAYLKKRWTTYELRNILSRTDADAADVILPVYLDEARIADVQHDVLGVIYERVGAEGLVELIADKIRARDGQEEED